MLVLFFLKGMRSPSVARSAGAKTPRSATSESLNSGKTSFNVINKLINPKIKSKFNYFYNFIMKLQPSLVIERKIKI